MPPVSLLNPKSSENWVMGMGNLDYKVFSIAIFTISALLISGSVQDVHAGSPGIFDMHVWSAGGGDDLWDNPANWFDGNVPESTETLSHGTIYIGCDFAPTPFGEGPAPTNVNVILMTEQTIVSPDNDGLMLCQGSTLTVDLDTTLEIVPSIPASPIIVSHTNFGNLIIAGTFLVNNNFANTDYIEVHLHNEGAITTTATGIIRVENNGANTADIEVKLTNDLSTSTITDNGLIVVANNGVVSPPNPDTSDVDVRIDNDGGTITVGGTLRLENTATVENNMGDGVILEIEVDNNGDITVEEDATFTIQNTAVITNALDDGDGNSGVEVDIKFDDNDGTLTIEDGGLVDMRNDGNFVDDENADLDLEFDDNDGTLDIKEGGKLLMENTGDLTTTAGANPFPQDAQVQIQFDDNDGIILNGGTLEMKNSGNVEAPCGADIQVQIDENEGPNGSITNDGIILLENTGDATDTVCIGNTSEIQVEIHNEGDGDEGGAILDNDGTITLKNSGDAEIIDVELENNDGGAVSNSGLFRIENTGDATVELDVGIENDDEISVINNQCGGVFNIVNEDGDGAGTEDVGVANDLSTINNFGTGLITVDDDGTVTENQAIAVVGDPINFIATCQGDSLPDVYVVMGSSGNSNPENGALATADLTTGDLTQVGAAIAPLVDNSVSEGGYSGLSGLAIDSSGRFFVTAVEEGSPSSLAEVDPLTGAIISDLGTTRIEDEGTEDVKIRDLSFQPETDVLFGVGKVEESGPSNALFTIDTSDATVELVSVFEGAGTIQGLAFDPTDGTLYGVNCSLWSFDTTPAPSGFMPDLVTDLDNCYDGLGIDPSGNVYGTSSGDDSLHLIDTSDGSDTTVAGAGTNPSDVDFTSTVVAISEGDGNGGLPYPDPNLGDPKHGQGHPNGFCMGPECMDVTGLFNHWPETNVPQGSTQSFTLTIACPRGAHTCDHIALAGALPDADFYDDRWTVSLDKEPMSDQWHITVMNDFGEIDADSVTATVQPVSQTMITSTINVPFLLPGSIGTADGNDPAHENNRHLHVTVHDSHKGSSNYIFNEGMYVEDIYAYPQVQTIFDPALDYEALCLNEDSTKRHTCAFDKVKDWTIKNAEDKLKEMYDQRGQNMDSYDESDEN